MRISRSLLVIIALAGSLRSQEANDQELMRRAKASLSLASILTIEDIPDAWKSRISTETVEGRTIVTHSRGAEKVLEVSWRDTSPSVFPCTLYSEGKNVGMIVRAAGRVTVLPARDSTTAKIITSLRDDGRLEVAIVGTNLSVEDAVIVDGRGSHLMSDLDYAKGRVIHDSSTWPMQEAMRRNIETKRP